MPVKAGKPISSDIAKHRDGYSLEFTLECKCGCRGLRLLAKEHQERDPPEEPRFDTVGLHPAWSVTVPSCRSWSC